MSHLEFRGAAYRSGGKTILDKNIALRRADQMTAERLFQQPEAAALTRRTRFSNLKNGPGLLKRNPGPVMQIPYTAASAES